MEAQINPPSKISRILHHGKPTAGSMKYGFTLMQLQELEQQSLIYKYIEAGVPIPNYLILPIWKSFARILNHQLFPIFFSYDPLYNCDPKSMDREPDRCRRTDGKKWRCSKNVVEGEKYCHRHRCRGRLRLRNHLEQPNAVVNKEMADSDIISETNLSINFSTNN